MTVPTSSVQADVLIAMAMLASDRAGCVRRSVGAVVYDRRTFQVLGTGANYRPGTPTSPCPRASSDVPSGSSYAAGMPGACDAIHAEEAALEDSKLLWAPDTHEVGVAVTCQPCVGCVALCARWGASEIIWPGESLALR